MQKRPSGLFLMQQIKQVSQREKQTKDSKAPFSERHPIVNTVIALAILLAAMVTAGIAIYRLFQLIGGMIVWIKDTASGLDAVVIVALITGTVSLTGVIITSIVSKAIDYKRTRREYLAKKREEPYGRFVDMVYKIILSSQSESFEYTTEEMTNEIQGFSKQLSLWGSKRVVKKWVEFRKSVIEDAEAAKKKVYLVEEIMNAMRKDLGVKAVKRGSLLSFFINDIEG